MVNRPITDKWKAKLGRGEARNYDLYDILLYGVVQS
jgi:hypothetical protein